MRYSDLDKTNRAVKYYSALKKACERLDIHVTIVGDVGPYKFVKLVINPDVEPTLLITAGIHGDEPAGPYGVVEWLTKAEYPDDLRIIIIPLINPSGFDDNERNNGDDRDLNRGFNIRKRPTVELKLLEKALNGESLSLLLSLHEDRGHGGIYLYHADVDEDVCRRILDDCSKVIPIVTEKSIYGDECERGMIYVGLKNKDPKHVNSLENALQALGVAQITFETPALAEFNKRSSLQAMLIQRTIDNFDELIS